MNWVEVGRFLLVAGVMIIIIGFVFVAADKIPLNRFNLYLGSGKFRIYIPAGMLIVLSVVITLLFNFFSRK